MTSKPDITAKYEEERIRAHEQSQVVYLQGQIDELRRLLKDQTNKYNWAMEQTRKTEAAVVQVQGLFERHTEEVARSTETARRDIITLRKEVAGAMVKIEESVKPFREMQSQIQQVSEARKQDRDYVSSWLGRIEDIEPKIVALYAQIKDSEERQRQYSAQIDRLREADTVAVQEARKVGEELQTEKQSLRRQIVESQQLVTDVHAVLEDHDARIIRLDEIRKHIDLFAETLPKQYAELSEKLPDITADIKRVERIATERFLMNQERMEDMRHQADERLNTLQETDEQHLRQLTAWLERVDGLLRELEHRLSRSTTTLESAQHDHIARIFELEKRELGALSAMAVAFQEISERSKIAQMEAKAEEEGSKA